MPTSPPIAPPPHSPRPIAAPSPQNNRSSDQTVLERIDEAASALWQAELVRRLLAGGLTIVGVWALFVLVDHWFFELPRGARWIGLAAWLAVTSLWLAFWIVPMFRRRVHLLYAARAIERDQPQLRGSLSSYLELRDQQDDPSLGGRIIRSLGKATADQLSADTSLPSEATNTMKYWIASIATLCLVLVYGLVSPKSVVQSTARLVMPAASIDAPKRVEISDVKPGDIETPAGKPVEFSATIQSLGSGDKPLCIVNGLVRPMQIELRALDDLDRYAGTLNIPTDAAGELTYRIEAGDAVSSTHRLKIKDLPVVTLQSVSIQPPAYTQAEPIVTRSGAITAIDGSRVTIVASVNREIGKARLEFNPELVGKQWRTTAGSMDMAISEDRRTITASFSLRGASRLKVAVETKSYRIVVQDLAEGPNENPIIYPVRIIEDLVPEVSITIPRSSPKNVPIDAQQVIEIQVVDPDYGLSEVALEMKSGIRKMPPITLLLDEKGRRGNQTLLYRLRPSELGCHVKDEIEITAVAYDNRQVDGDETLQPNRTVSDPIEINIVASAEVSPTADPQSDGLSKVDDQPSKSDPSGEQDGQGNASGGSSGSKSQNGDGNQGSSGSSGQSGNQDPSESSSSPSQNNSGNGSSNQESGDSSDDANSTPNEDSQGSGSQNSRSQSSGSQDSGSNGSDSPPSNQAKGSNNNPNSKVDPRSINPSGNDSGKSNESTPPQHDAEAFERIKEYLDEQSKGSQQNGSSDSSNNQRPENSPSTDSMSGSTGNKPDRQPSTENQQKAKGEQGPGEKESAVNGTGEKGADNKGTGEKGAGEKGADEKGTGEKGTGEKGTGEKGTGEKGTGEKGADNKGTGEKGADEKGSSEKGTGEKGTDDKGTSEKGTDEKGTGEKGTDDKGTSEKGTDEKGTGEKGTGEKGTGEKGTGEKGTGEKGTGEKGTGEKGTGEKGTGEKGAGEKEKDPESGNDSGDGNQSTNSSTGQPSRDKNGKPMSTSGSTSGSTTGTPAQDNHESSLDGPLPPDPVNEQYAKQATDLVLDYLNRTRDQPDPELLDRLKWSPDDLKRFQQRWNEIRRKGQSNDPNQQASFEETLRSLGLRPPSGSSQNSKGVNDGFNKLRDSGSRTKPPAAYQDAFDAFRRFMGRNPSAAP